MQAYGRHYTNIQETLVYCVPHGSVLPPILFHLYMKLLNDIIRKFGLWCHQYAEHMRHYHLAMGWMIVSMLKPNRWRFYW